MCGSCGQPGGKRCTGDNAMAAHHRNSTGAGARKAAGLALRGRGHQAGGEVGHNTAACSNRELFITALVGDHDPIDRGPMRTSFDRLLEVRDLVKIMLHVDRAVVRSVVDHCMPAHTHHLSLFATRRFSVALVWLAGSARSAGRGAIRRSAADLKARPAAIGAGDPALLARRAVDHAARAPLRQAAQPPQITG